jgi:sirohydrochlorin ferrochelatase
MNSRASRPKTFFGCYTTGWNPSTLSKKISKPLTMSPPDQSTAVLLIAHGSRRAEANDDLVQLANLISDRGDFEVVEVSYLELAEPSIPRGGRNCVDRGARLVLMMPYFLSAGVHVVNDLEAMRSELVSQFPQVEFVLCPHLGLHPLMADIVLDRLTERK